jgi:hypothetical protein
MSSFYLPITSRTAGTAKDGTRMKNSQAVARWIRALGCVALAMLVAWTLWFATSAYACAAGLAVLSR